MTSAVENLLALYERNESREADLAWYADARREVKRRARKQRIPWRTYTGVVAATSPQQMWITKDGRYANLEIADRVVGWFRGERETAGTLGRSAAKSAAILCGADPADVLGPKTRNFWLALLGKDTVVLDRWALRAIGEDDSRSRDIARDYRLYVALSQPYIEAARIAGVSASALQAATWTQIRRESAAII